MEAFDRLLDHLGVEADHLSIKRADGYHENVRQPRYYEQLRDRSYRVGLSINYLIADGLRLDDTHTLRRLREVLEHGCTGWWDDYSINAHAWREIVRVITAGKEEVRRQYEGRPTPKKKPTQIAEPEQTTLPEASHRRSGWWTIVKILLVDFIIAWCFLHWYGPVRSWVGNAFSISTNLDTVIQTTVVVLLGLPSFFVGWLALRHRGP